MPGTSGNTPSGRGKLNTQYLAQLKASLLFEGASDDAVARVRDRGSILALASGERVSTELKDVRLYVILKGRLHARDAGHQGQDMILEAGQCFGPKWLMTGFAPPSEIVALDDSILLSIAETELWALVDASHTVACNLLAILTKGLAERDPGRTFPGVQRRKPADTVDGITGLHNARWLEENFPRAMVRCSRDNQAAVLLLVDTDHFRRCNEARGAAAGDRLLRQVASVLVDQVRPGDLIARCGGDEFAVLLPDTTLEHGLNVAERLRAAVAAKRIRLEAGLSPVTVSVGAAEMRFADNLGSLWSDADAALYRAKINGRNRVETSRAGLERLMAHM